MSSMDCTLVVERLADKTGILFRGASGFDLSQAEELGFPESVLEFYREFNPESCVESQVRLWPLADALIECTEGVPGIYLTHRGYLAFASTMTGDAYCFDRSRRDLDGNPSVVIFSHEIDFELMPDERVRRHAKRVASNLQDFLEQMNRESVDETCFDHG